MKQIYRAIKYKYDFQQYETIRSFDKSIYTGKNTIDEGEEDQNNLLENKVEFNNTFRPKSNKVKVKRNIFDRVNALYEGRELTLNAFKSGIFPVKATQGKILKIITTKQMLQRLPIDLTKVRTDNHLKMY